VTERRCKECEAGTKRPAPHPGPRCATHHREEMLRRRKAAHDRRLAQVYSITPAVYAALYRLQGGTCAICQRATGARKRLAVDHDHSCCDAPTSCGRCVRGLLCKSCNQMLGRMRDSPEAFERAAAYLRYPPARDLGLVLSASAAAGSRSARAGSSAAGAPGSAT
jgi:hypothetical protein